MFKLLAPLALWLATLAFASPLATFAQTPFRLGVINERLDKPDHALEQYEKLHAYLSRKLAEQGVAVGELLIAGDVNEMSNRVALGEVDAVIEGVMPSLAVAQRTQRLEPALIAWRKGQRQYHTVFFVRKDSPVLGLDDLKGRVIAFESSRSTSAYYVPKSELLASGLGLATKESDEASPEAVRYVFAGSELNQAYWVHRGRADAGAFNNGDWDRVPPAIKQDLRIVHTTRPVLRWLLSFHVDVPPHLAEAVSGVLLGANLNAEGAAALEAAARIAKFEPLTPSDRADLAYWAGVLKAIQ
jgi:phosphonate transport system substrate-binding protein